MDINSLMETLGGAVAVSAEIRDWCTATYGQAQSVFESLDLRLLESSEACPLVVVHASGKSGGLSNDRKRHLVAVETLVHDEVKTTDATGVVVFQGGRNVESLRKLVFQAVKAAMPPGCRIDAVDTEYGTVDQFPFFWCGMQLTLSEAKLIGQDPFE